MSSSCEVSGNYLLNLRPLQLSIVSKYIKNELVCSITCDTFTSPHTSPCGHTFDYPSICQALEHKKICPLDRADLTVDKLIRNNLVSEIVEQRLLVIFLAVLGKDFPYECAITRKPLFEAVKLPCGHIFSKFGITKWYHTIKKCCPFDNTEFNISDIVPDPIKSQLAQEQYPAYLAGVKLFNSNLSSKVIEWHLDDRASIMNKLLEVSTCPISKNIIETPVIATCGHTFDSASINDESSCPHDNLKLSKAQVFHNRIAQDLLEHLSSKFFKEANANIDLDREDRQGVFLFLKPETTLEKIRNIAISLGIVRSCPRFIVKGREIFDTQIPISQIESLDETVESIPILHVI